jgi:HEPN domain-containing protein
MTEKWSLYLAKAEQNTDAANLLFNKAMHGLAAYHAQQALELSVKACVYRFGFEEYLKLKRVTELEFALGQGRHDPLYEHNPSVVLLRAGYRFCHEEVERLKARQKIDPSLIPVFEEVLDATRQIRNLMDKMDEKKQVKLEIWKCSLGLGTKDEETERLIAGIKRASESRIVERFIEHSFSWLYGVLEWLRRNATRTHQSHKIFTAIIPEARRLLQKGGLPSEFAEAFFAKDRETYQKIINDFVAEKGMWNALNILFRPGGLFDEAAKMWGSETATVDEIGMPFNDLRNYYIWISYIVAMSYPMILLFPHEEFGRYPTPVDERNTELIYAECYPELRKRIDESSEACKVIKGLILNEEIPE